MLGVRSELLELRSWIRLCCGGSAYHILQLFISLTTLLIPIASPFIILQLIYAYYCAVDGGVVHDRIEVSVNFVVEL